MSTELTIFKLITLLLLCTLVSTCSKIKSLHNTSKIGQMNVNYHSLIRNEINCLHV